MSTDADLVESNTSRPVEDFEDEESTLDLEPADQRVKTEKQDVPVEAICTWVTRGKLDLQPDFQRLFVWNRVKASRLIESILLEIPIPVIYVSENALRKYEVVDGQQRTQSIVSFIEGRFPDGKTFRLSGLKVLGELNGAAFEDLDDHQREAILAYSIRMIVISRDSNPDVKFEVFERLNLGSVRLNNQELRNCVYRGALNDLAKDLAGNQFLRKIMGLENPHPRMEDVHLVLRFIAMRHNSHLNYKSPMKQFLNRFLETNRQAPAQQIKEWRRQFEDAIESAWHVFGEHSFRRFEPKFDDTDTIKWSKNLNTALWDTVLYCISQYPKQKVILRSDQVREEFIQLMTDDDKFREYTSAQTDNTERLRYRAETLRLRLAELFGTDVRNEPRVFSRELKDRLFSQSPACKICGQRIHDIDDAEVDHIEHYWRGGKTIPDNARLVHAFCNRSRGGRD